VCEETYNPNQFNFIAVHSSSFSGQLYNQDSLARIGYWPSTGLPCVYFDGVVQMIGAGSNYQNGVPYMNVINPRLEELVPLVVYVDDYTFEGAAEATIKVKMLDDLGSSTNGHFIRTVLVEDEVYSGGDYYKNVMRDMLDQRALTISAAGEEQVFTIPITISGAYNVDHLKIVTFVQRDSDRFVYNSGSSMGGEFVLVAGVDGIRQAVSDGTEVAFGNTSLVNVGFSPDTYDVTLDMSSMPEGWDAHFLYDGVEYTSTQIALEPYDNANLTVVIANGDNGSGRVRLDIFSQAQGEVVESFDFMAHAGGTDFIVVADESGEAAAVYDEAVAATGKSHITWDNSLSSVSSDILLAYDAVIWETGSNGTCLNDADRTALSTFLAAEGRLFLAGEDVLQSLYDQSGSARLWYQLKLRINYSSGNSGNLNVNGVDGDPIGDGLAFTLTGGDPDQLLLIPGQPVEVSFEFGNGEPAGVRTTYSNYMVVTLPFGLERVPTQDERDAILENSLQWLGVLTSTPVEDLPMAGLGLAQNAPNPFNPSTKISFRLDQDGPVKLEVFNARGQLVRVLADGALAAGQHEVTWNGRDQSGLQASSGTYFYRLSTNGEQLTRKMTLVK
jgi:hypothetical protein